MIKPLRIACLALVWLIALVLLIACNQISPTTEPLVTAIPVEKITPSATAVPTCDPFTTPATSPPINVPTYTYQIINSYPHDQDAFTQGLIFVDGELYESTGIKRTPSSLRRVDLVTGEALQFLDVGNDFFTEGLVLWEDRLIQLTWQNRVAFVYDKGSFALLETWEYETEGWGITHNGRCLIMSDGTDTLTFRDPDTFAEVGRLIVQDQNGPVRLLNELEFINGQIWANIWRSNRIVQIDPATGQVVGNIDLTGLLDPATLTQPVDVLNGIAYDEGNGRLFVTGKLWPALFEIELIPQNSE
ncbi:glutaminyl-peptide cyclotransferase [Candidatus Leptofilum sp.]|uniref:glutaminyl-peptide cyclotransferase n=1 Tax=Candidatus Leptofilum sp. TaxID=3241576 RepID=UPI003B591EED